MAEQSYPQTDTRQSERQRERQGNVVDYAEQEFARSRETLKQVAQAARSTGASISLKEAGADKAIGVPAEGAGHKYPGVRPDQHH